MKSYSKIFKATNLSLIDEKKIIRHPLIHVTSNSAEKDSLEQEGKEQADSVNLLISDAEETAKKIIEMAEEKARSIELAANEKINQWWDENYKRLEELSSEAKQNGFDQGYQNGRQEAEAEVLKEYNARLENVQQLIQQAYTEKEKIISEAEPFLLELSTVIASQIIKQELDKNPDQYVELIKQHLLRFKEKEFITICVHPEDFDFIHTQRSHLIAVVNGETEIKIIPDHSVSPKGCVIRTAYGSVDARIDTQIDEIKKAIIEARREPESAVNS